MTYALDASRQYVFRRRGDRRRIAIRLAHGVEPAQIAAIERMRESEVGFLLSDPGFAALRNAHAELLGRSRDERLAHLADLALDLLQIALVAGDVRVAIFFATETRAGSDPSRTLALAVDEAMQRHGLARGTDGQGDTVGGPPAFPGHPPSFSGHPPAFSGHPPARPAGQALPGMVSDRVAGLDQPDPPVKPGGDETGGAGPLRGEDIGGASPLWGDEASDPRRPLSRAERCLLPERPAKVPAAPRRSEADFPYCAATLPTPEAAVALAAEQAARVDANHAATLRGLMGQLLNEVERASTALGAKAPPPPSPAPFRAPRARGPWQGGQPRPLALGTAGAAPVNGAIGTAPARLLPPLPLAGEGRGEGMHPMCHDETAAPPPVALAHPAAPALQARPPPARMGSDHPTPEAPDQPGEAPWVEV